MGCGDHALTVGSRHHHAQLVRGADQLALEPRTLLAGLPVASAGDEGGAHPLLRAGPQQLDVHRRGRAHEHEVGAAVGDLAHVAQAGAPEDLAALSVHGEDFTVVPEAQQVVQGGEAKLARVGRGPGNRDAAGVEQRPKALEDGRIGRRRRGASRLHGVVSSEHHERIHRHGRAAANDERVHVGAEQVGPLQRQAAQPQQHRLQRRFVYGRLSTKGLGEQVARAQAPDQSPRLVLAQRGRREGHVAQGLGQHAPQPPA